VAERVTEEAFRRGLILYPGSGGANTEEGDHLLIAPPFVITEEQIRETVSLLKEAMDAVYLDLESSAVPMQAVSAS
jgi:adenosylmethionine-8-amino-7-oxononanoate aminotransferase